MSAETVKILCVDADPYILNILQRFFRADEFDVLTAGSAQQGIEIFKQCAPVQIVIADFRMPGMNGVDFLRLVDQAAAKTVKILISGCAEQSVVSSVHDERLIFRYLSKPWARAELRKTIAEALDFIS